MGSLLMFGLDLVLLLPRLALKILTPPALKAKPKRKCPDCGHNLEDHNLDQRGRVQK